MLLVSDNQYGFFPPKFVVIQLIRSLSRTYENIGAASHSTCLLLSDFSKAFDTIKHSIVIQNCLLFNYNTCSITALLFGKSANLSDLTLGGNVMKHRKEVKVLGLIIKDNLYWSDYVENRISQAMKNLTFMIQNTSFRLSASSTIHFYRVVINSVIASECWDLNPSEYRLIQSFNGKVLGWVLGDRNFKEALTLCNQLPPLYMKVLKDLLLYNNIYLGILTWISPSLLKSSGMFAEPESNFQTSYMNHNAMTSGIELDTGPIS